MTVAIDILTKQFEEGTIWEIFDIFPIGIAIATDVTCAEIIHNSKSADIFRIEPFQSLSYSVPVTEHLPRIFHKGKELADYEMPMQRSAQSGESCAGFEFDLHWKDGITKTVLLNSCPLYSKEGIIVGALATFEDITERKQLENELNQHRNQLEQLVCERTSQLAAQLKKCRQQSQLLDLAHDFIIVMDLNSKIIYWNQSAEIGYGWSKQEAMGQVIHHLLQTKFPEPIDSIIDTLVTTGFWEGELIHCPKNGEPIITKSHWALNLDEYGNPVSILEINHDITTEKRYEKELLRLDQFNIIGELAAGIGHEIRNPLTTVRGYLQMFALKKKYTEHKVQFNTMIEELDRANSIISEYLSLAKDKDSHLQFGNINTIFEALFPLLQADAFFMGHTVELNLGAIPFIAYNENSLRQLLLNLVRNAFESMKHGGTVLIKTYFTKGKVVLSVQDNGPGIPNEIIDKVGTPFFTTKENGSGLGLAVCHRIVEHHNGELKVETGPDGTTFSVYFNQLPVE